MASIILHAAGLWLLLPHRGGREGVEAPPAIEVELVEQAPAVKGAADPTAGQPVPERSLPAPVADIGPPPPPPAAPQTAGPASTAAVHLGGEEQDLDGLKVSGDNVRPPRPDARVHNMPPHYPPEAARRGAQGVVGLRAHITENGVPAWVTVVGSSGDASLDRAAQDAVALWRFVPARSGGNAVTFDYDLAIRFVMDGR